MAPQASDPNSSSKFKVVFVGAGGVNFGSLEGPWNHSARLESILGKNLEVTALVSPAGREKVLALKRSSPAATSYANTKEYDDVSEFLADLASSPDSDSIKPDLVLVGVPPAYHGNTAPGTDIEIQLSNSITNNFVLFVEKPMSSSPVQDVKLVGKYLADKHRLVSVGYFMRYLKLVQTMKDIISSNNLTVIATVARYTCCYAAIAKKEWWMKSISCGPIVEQGTHFCDLSRYFGGDVDISTVQAHAVEHNEAPGKLSSIPIDEESIPEEDRIPRLTSAIWKYKSGAVGSIVHGINLQGVKFNCELEVHADGWLLHLMDPYHSPVLKVRSPASDEPKIFTAPGDDPYLNQMQTVVAAARNPASTKVLSTWEDASKTYELTWAIRHASEASSGKGSKIN